MHNLSSHHCKGRDRLVEITSLTMGKDTQAKIGEVQVIGVDMGTPPDHPVHPGQIFDGDQEREARVNNRQVSIEFSKFEHRGNERG